MIAIVILPFAVLAAIILLGGWDIGENILFLVIGLIGGYLAGVM